METLLNLAISQLDTPAEWIAFILGIIFGSIGTLLAIKAINKRIINLPEPIIKEYDGACVLSDDPKIVTHAFITLKNFKPVHFRCEYFKEGKCAFKKTECPILISFKQKI